MFPSSERIDQPRGRGEEYVRRYVDLVKTDWRSNKKTVRSEIWRPASTILVTERKLGLVGIN